MAVSEREYEREHEHAREVEGPHAFLQLGLGASKGWRSRTCDHRPKCRVPGGGSGAAGFEGWWLRTYSTGVEKEAFGLDMR